ncbi:MAG: fasciclin domain-containing protein, partial [Gemmataceae bacterium]
MKTKMLSMLAVLFVFGTAVRSADEKDIVDTAAGNKDFSTLVTAVKEAALVETLKGKGPFTVFAPTDEAFKKLGEEKIKAVLADKDLLKKILLAHVVTEKSVMAADVVKMNGEKVNGFTVKVDGETVMLGGAKVIKTDIKCS